MPIFPEFIFELKVVPSPRPAAIKPAYKVLTDDVDLDVILPIIRRPQLENGQLAGVKMAHSLALESALFRHASIARQFGTGRALFGPPFFWLRNGRFALL